VSGVTNSAKNRLRDHRNSARNDRGVELLAAQPNPVPCVGFQGASDSPGASMNNPNQQKPNQQQQNNPRPGEQQGGGGQKPGQQQQGGGQQKPGQQKPGQGGSHQGGGHEGGQGGMNR
jgi:hypothetical protein